MLDEILYLVYGGIITALVFAIYLRCKKDRASKVLGRATINSGKVSEFYVQSVSSSQSEGYVSFSVEEPQHNSSYRTNRSSRFSILSV